MKQVPRVIKPNEEPTTKTPEIDNRPKPEKLVENPKINKGMKTVSDIRLVQATQQKNSKFIVESIKFAPGKQIASIISTDRLVPTSLKLVMKNTNSKFSRIVMATATGQTSADKPVRNIPNFFGVPNIENDGDASLILEPSAKAIAGANGIAISAPLSRAILRPGTSVKVLWRPDSVAIVGPGGRAHAHADLVLEYLSSKRIEHGSENIINLPYYGVAKGQTLQIRQNADGSVKTEIIQNNLIKDKLNESDSFQYNLRIIQQAATELVNLQTDVKKTGHLSIEGQKVYAENLEKLGISAQRLAHIQKETGSEDFKLLFEQNSGTIIQDSIQHGIEKVEILNANKKTSNENVSDTNDNDSVGEQSEEKEEEKEEEEENVGEESESSGSSDGTSGGNDTSDTIEVNAPDEDASIAEAKPVGLAIAGVGGVASSKPVATAIVGDGGLAIANPIATAIAGLSPDELSDLELPLRNNNKDEPHFLNRHNLPLKGKYGLVESSIASEIGLLVGPKYHAESRISDTEIQAELDHKVSMLMNANKQDNIMANMNPNVNLKHLQQNTNEQFNLAIAPETILPNQYPLFAPNYNPFVATNRMNWSPQQAPGYEAISHDHSSLDQDRSILSMSGYDPSHYRSEQMANYDYQTPTYTLQQYPPYQVYFY